MKKLLLFPLILVLVLSGCAEHPVAPAAEDFTFDLPEGYSIGEITDLSCSILRDADGAACGGESEKIEVNEALSGTVSTDGSTSMEKVIGGLGEMFMERNPENPVSDLDVETIVKIYTGAITNWSQVGGADTEIVLIGREAGSGTRDGFESITGTEDACKRFNFEFDRIHSDAVFSFV